MLPLVHSTGAGAEMRHAMGVAVFAGMIGVTLFGLFLTPVFYVLLRRLTGNRQFRVHSARLPTALRIPGRHGLPMPGEASRAPLHERARRGPVRFLNEAALGTRDLAAGFDRELRSVDRRSR